MASEVNVTINGSLMQNMDKLFIDDDGNYTESTDLERQIRAHIHIFLEILKLILCILALISDIYLIVIIAKYKNLQNRINKFILLYAIFNLLYMVLENLMFIVQLGFYQYDFCLIHSIQHLFITLSFYFLTLMAVDWYTLNYHLIIYERFSTVFKYGASIVSLFAIFKFIISFLMCFVDSYNAFFVRFCFEEASFILCLVIVICITILKQKKVSEMKTNKTEYALTVSRTVLLLSMPSFIFSLIFEIVYNGPLETIFMQILFMLKLFSENFSYAAPIVVVYLLAKTNKHFKIAHFKCCKKRVKDYKDDNLDVESVHENQETHVKFDRDTQAINF